MKKYCILLGLVLVMIGCSQSGRRTATRQEPAAPADSMTQVTAPVVNPDPVPVDEELQTSGEKTVVKMEKMGGVYYIPVEVNGVNMRFVFDTGASTISISQVEAMYLYKQGMLTRADIVGSANFTDANGDISEGTVITLKTVKIGDRTLKNVEASVVHNLRAPLLFGQSALGKFGRISIDNTKGEITFE